jgi:CarboxypepD_reg-like domain/TonB-dependent Receptor Plug Domain
MIMKKYCFQTLLLFWLATTANFAQNTTISGEIIDAQTSSVLPFVSVYLSNTSFATQTDSIGRFKLSNIPTGKYSLVASMIGYQTVFQTISIDDKPIEPLTIKLQVAENVLTEVSVKGKRDKKWANQLKAFEADFFGNSSFTRQCKILNSWVLEFEEPNDETFSATANRPLEIENRALGYKVYYDLKKFEITPTQFNLQGFVRFQELGYESKKQLQQYEANRTAAFVGSERHFLKSLVTHQLKQQGFAVYSVNDKFEGNGKASHLNQQLGKRLLPFSDSLLVLPTLNADIVAVTLPKEIEILNTNEVSYQTTYQDAPYPVSWLVLLKNRVECTKEGVLLNASQAVWAGDIAKRRMAMMLPTNYLYTQKTTSNIQELEKSIQKETEPAVSLLHDFVDDSLKITIRFSKQVTMKGNLSISVVQISDSIFVETEKSETDTTTNIIDNKSVQLDNVTVKGKRETKPKSGGVQYVLPDVVQTSDAFQDDATGNVLTRLQDKIPGIRIVEIIDDYGQPQYKINVRASKKSSFLQYEPPLVLMNGVPFSQNLNDLRAVSLRDVARIEVFKSAHALFGSRGANGVINVVTKSQVGISAAANAKPSGYFNYKPNNVFDSGKDFNANFWIAEKGKKLMIVVTGKSTDGQVFYVEKNVVSR